MTMKWIWRIFGVALVIIGADATMILWQYATVSTALLTALAFAVWVHDLWFRP